jgi:hypothetical protein
VRSYLQIIGVGEGRRATTMPGPSPAPTGVPAASPRGPVKFGRPAVTDFERAQMARLPGPKAVAHLDGTPTYEYAMAAGGEEMPTDGAPFTGEPTVSIKTAAVRPVVMLSQYKPPSGGAKNPQTGKPI